MTFDLRDLGTQTSPLYWSKERKAIIIQHCIKYISHCSPQNSNLADRHRAGYETAHNYECCYSNTLHFIMHAMDLKILMMGAHVVRAVVRQSESFRFDPLTLVVSLSKIPSP